MAEEPADPAWEKWVTVNDLTIYYPVALRAPIVTSTDVLFEGTQLPVPLDTDLTLWPLQHTDIVFEGRKVHIYPCELGILDKIEVVGETKRFDVNTVSDRKLWTFANTMTPEAFAEDVIIMKSQEIISADNTRAERPAESSKNARDHVTQDFVTINGKNIYFTTGMKPTLLSDNKLRFPGAGRKKSRVPTSKGYVALVHPLGWTIQDHECGVQLVRDVQHAAVTESDEGDIAARQSACALAGGQITFSAACPRAPLHPMSVPDERLLTLKGFHVNFPTDAAPEIHGTEIDFPGLLQHVAAFPLPSGGYITARYREDMEVRFRGDSLLFCFKPEPAKQNALPDLEQAIDQAPRHCRHCPRMLTPYEEECVEFKGIRFYYPPDQTANVDNALSEVSFVENAGELDHVTVFGIIKLYCPPHCDIVVGHEVHIYPAEANVLRRYGEDPHHRLLMGSQYNLKDSRIFSLELEPQRREARIHATKVWTDACERERIRTRDYTIGLFDEWAVIINQKKRPFTAAQEARSIAIAKEIGVDRHMLFEITIGGLQTTTTGQVPPTLPFRPCVKYPTQEEDAGISDGIKKFLEEDGAWAKQADARVESIRERLAEVFPDRQLPARRTQPAAQEKEVECTDDTDDTDAILKQSEKWDREQEEKFRALSTKMTDLLKSRGFVRR
ncbi:hypothetical protein JX265_006044 [Neoarthrinium moseri]|uniref:Uncharacterized protein n=1 Tax=Neoarthrinium moseri TaxID=1658444 RepID=A0A9Q0APW8_9PEZI|nr:hypothetical protein JX265_006044 [Neoarthrinium moseri]